MTPLEEAKIKFSDASVNLEIAQGMYNEAKKRLVEEMNKPVETTPLEKKTE